MDRTSGTWQEAWTQTGGRLSGSWSPTTWISQKRSLILENLCADDGYKIQTSLSFLLQMPRSQMGRLKAQQPVDCVTSLDLKTCFTEEPFTHLRFVTSKTNYILIKSKYYLPSLKLISGIITLGWHGRPLFTSAPPKPSPPSPDSSDPTDLPATDRPACL